MGQCGNDATGDGVRVRVEHGECDRAAVGGCGGGALVMGGCGGGGFTFAIGEDVDLTFKGFGAGGGSEASIKEVVVGLGGGGDEGEVVDKGNCGVDGGDL